MKLNKKNKVIEYKNLYLSNSLSYLIEMSQENKEINKTPIFVSNLWIIVGPDDNQNKVCLECLVSRFKINKEFINKFSESSAVEVTKDDLILLEQLLTHKLPEQGIIINRINFETYPISISKMENCKICNNHLIDNEDFPIDTKKMRVNRKFSLPDLKRSVDWYGGIIKMKYTNVNSNLYPMVGAMLYFDENHDTYVGGFGRNKSINKSEEISYLEGFERYFTSNDKRYDHTVLTSYKNLEKNDCRVVHPKEFICVSDDKENSFDEQKNYKWCKVKSLKKQEDKWVLNQFLNYYDATVEDSQERFFATTSSGCSLGTTIEESIIYSLLELLERDAFLVAWQGETVNCEIDLNSINNSVLLNMINSLDIHGYKAHLYDITTESKIPVIWTFLESKETQEKIFHTYSAAGSNIMVENAIEASLLEAMSSLGVYESILDNKEDKEYIKKLGMGIKKVEEMEDHMKLYANKNMKSRFDFLKNAPLKSVSQLEKEYYIEGIDGVMPGQQILKKITENIYRYFGDIYVYEFISDTLSQYKLRATRVLIPNLIPMTFGEDNACISNKRIEKFYQYKGLNWSGEINKLAHPFP